jgi:Flp pilus assembly protein TadB
VPSVQVPSLLQSVVPSLLGAAAALLWWSRPSRHVLASAMSRPGRARAPTGSPEAAGTSPGSSDRQVLLRLAAGAAAGAAVWAFVPGGWGSVAAVVTACAVWRRSSAWEPASARRQRLRVEAELPWVVDLLTTALSAGLGPVEALSRVVEVSPPSVRTELQVPLARLRLGVDPVSVWSGLAEHPALGRLGTTLRRATESGAPVVDALGRLADDLRAGRRAAVEVRVRRIEVRAAVPLGLCLLPAFVLLAVVPLVAGSAARLLSG